MSIRENLTRTIIVRNRRIGAGEPIFLTAEIGAAHAGKLENAIRMIEAAAKAGCDGADIFMADPNDFYWYGDIVLNRDIRDIYRELAYTDSEWKTLFDYAREKNLILYPTPLDCTSVERCHNLGVEMININSDDSNNPFLLKEAAQLGVPVTMHDINASIAEVSLGIQTLQANGCRDIILLHSTNESGDLEMLYHSANLELIQTYRQHFSGSGVLVGCVEHTTSDFLIYAVAALKPVLISKHIQLCAKDNPGDDKISVDTANLSRMVHNVRSVEGAMGNGFNQMVCQADGKVPEENVARRKVLVARRDIPAGKRIVLDDLTAKRPGNRGGAHPMQYLALVGAVARQDIPADTPLEFRMFDELATPPYKWPPIDVFQCKTTSCP